MGSRFLVGARGVRLEGRPWPFLTRRWVRGLFDADEGRQEFVVVSWDVALD